jgi:hypothetical protein
MSEARATKQNADYRNAPHTISTDRVSNGVLLTVTQNYTGKTRRYLLEAAEWEKLEAPTASGPAGSQAPVRAHDKVMFTAAAKYRNRAGETRAIIQVPFPSYVISDASWPHEVRFITTEIGAPVGDPGECITIRSRDEVDFLAHITEADESRTTIEMEYPG